MPTLEHTSPVESSRRNYVFLLMKFNSQTLSAAQV